MGNVETERLALALELLVSDAATLEPEVDRRRRSRNLGGLFNSKRVLLGKPATHVRWPVACSHCTSIEQSSLIAPRIPISAGHWCSAEMKRARGQTRVYQAAGRSQLTTRNARVALGMVAMSGCCRM
jgi:hypothetical protein